MRNLFQPFTVRAKPRISAPSYVASTTIAAALTTAGTLAVGYPAGLAAGDTLLLQVGIRNYGGTNAPTASGWSVAFGPQTTGNCTQSLYVTTALATGSESGTFNLTWSGGASHNMVCAVMHAFRNVSNNDLVNNGAAGAILDTQGGASSGAASALSFTTPVPGILLVVCGASNSGSALGAATWTARVDAVTAVGNDFTLNMVTTAMSKVGTQTGGNYADMGGDATVLRGFGLHGKYT